MSKRRSDRLARETEDYLGAGVKYQRVDYERRSLRLYEKDQGSYEKTTIIKVRPVQQQQQKTVNKKEVSPPKPSPPPIIITGGGDNDKTKKKEKNAYEMNPVELYQYLSHKLKGQDETLHKLVAILYPFNRKVGKRLICPILLAGVSGVGKSKTAKLLRKLYQVVGAQYIKFSLTKITDETQVNQILGAGPGLEGYGSEENIPHKLLEAIGQQPVKRYEGESLKAFTTRKEREEQKQQQQPPPKTIILHFDELNQAHHEFLKLFLTFFDDGTLSASDGTTFVLPDETRIIVLFTANYAEDEILSLSPLYHFQEARTIIENVMEGEGKIAKASIGRFCGNILPYFKLPDDIVAAIKREKLCKGLTHTHHGYKEYINTISYGEEELDAIENLMCRSNDAMGMRSIKASVTMFMNDLYYNLTNYIIKYMPPTTIPLDLNFSYHSYDEWQYEELTLLMKLPDFREIMKPHVAEKIKQKMENFDDIGLLVVRCDKQILHAILVDGDGDGDKQLQVYGGGGGGRKGYTPDAENMNLIVNIRKNVRNNNYEISAYDGGGNKTPIMIDYGFRKLLELAKK